MDPLLSTALEAAEAAARVHLVYFGEVGPDDARRKAHSDFVSRVDLEAQEAALSVILQRHPDHRVLAEEDPGGEDGGRGERTWPEDGRYLWIVDPLDGTTNYLHRHPQFAASVGVGRRVREVGAGAGDGPKAVREAGDGAGDGPKAVREVGDGIGDGPKAILEVGDGIGDGPKAILEAGAVVAARTGERWWARRGQGAFKNGLPIRVSPLRALKAALIGTGFPFKEPGLVPRYLEEFQRVLPASGGVRRGGSAALDLCYLAEGILDGFWEEDYLSPWDVAAGLVILREAGGLATRLDGSEIDLKDGSVLAANSPAILKELGALVRGP